MTARWYPPDYPEPRWWFTSRLASLEAIVREAVVAEHLERSLILPPDVFGPSPTTDGGPFHLAGVPLVNFLTAPFYLFDAIDTLDKIHRPSLVPVTRAAIRIIASTHGVSARRYGMSERTRAARVRWGRGNHLIVCGTHRGFRTSLGRGDPCTQ